ncbi:MAG TPA: hypothetical protein PKK06_01545 [Phycisphaerae bacterium]|nr:hypothetical protein [Phycisphaerae bacterium]HNU44190.1 hypothetical protein [Phycisphaerae bacterium]
MTEAVVVSSEHDFARVELSPISTRAYCGYSLGGSYEQLRCPECSMPFSLDDCTVVVENPAR